jgi:hypothetical protein
LRMRVSRSAMGSFMDIALALLAYQLDLVTPGNLPSRARFRKHIRHSWNFR